MKFRVLGLLVGSILLPAFALAATTFRYTAPTSSQLRLFRDGDCLAIEDERSQRIVASAFAPSISRVEVRGADGDEDDTLNVDLSQPFHLPGGIGYDGGRGGYDTLVLSGGTTQAQKLTHYSQSDGLVELDGLQLLYTNLEPVVDTAVAASLTLTYPATDNVITVTSSGGNWVVTAPGTETYTFSNKTTVTIDGDGGVDSITFNVSGANTGLSTLLVNNMESVATSATLPVANLGVNSAAGSITLSTNVTNFEAKTINGDVSVVNAGPMVIGGVGAAPLTGINVTGSGSVNVQTNGTLFLSDADGLETIRGVTGVTLTAVGGAADITATVNRDSIATTGFINLVAGRNVQFGSGGVDFDNDVRAGTDISITAGAAFIIDGFSDMAADDMGLAPTGLLTISAPTITLQKVNGTDASVGVSGAGGTVSLQAGPNGTVTVDAQSLGALFASLGTVLINADRLVVTSTSGVSGNSVVIEPVTNPWSVNLGSVVDNTATTLEISDVEIDRIAAPQITIGSTKSTTFTVSSPVSTANSLSLINRGGFNVSGTGALSGSPKISFTDLSTIGRTWTISSSHVNAGGGAIPYSSVGTLELNGGGGSDTFSIVPSSTTTMTVDANSPTPPTSPGDQITVNAAGTTAPVLAYYTTAGGHEGAFTFLDRAAVHFREIETVTSPLPNSPAAPGDFQGDRKGDLFWRHLGSGANAAWLMDAGTLAANGALPSVFDPNFKVVGLGDFQGDKKVDVLWRNQVTGANVIWLMDGMTVAATGVLPNVPAPWTVAAVGDFQNDGKADIFWRDPGSGNNSIWFMNGLTMALTAAVVPVNSDFAIVATGDFQADGKTDIMWRSLSSGTPVIWLMDGANVAVSAPQVNVPLAFDVVGSGDFQLDGKGDILWRNKNTGDNVIWFMNGTAFGVTAVLPPVGDTNWKVARVIDLQRDGKADIVWRNSVSGDNAFWLLDGGNLVVTGSLTPVADTQFQIATTP